MRTGARLALALLLLLAVAACGGGEDGGDAGVDDWREFSFTVNHPLFPYSELDRVELRGRERGRPLRAVYSVDGTGAVRDVPVVKVRVRRFVDGQLVDDAWEYYSQHADGSVWQLGRQHVKTLVGWLAGSRGSKASMVMTATPVAGDQMEIDSDVDKHRSTVVALDVPVTTEGGNFTECVQTSDYDPVKKLASRRWYCPGVGLVRVESQDERLQLVAFA